ncbi:MAG: hypothetical protein ACREN3_01850 [Gemmatimonadaceae bacterium]
MPPRSHETLVRAALPLAIALALLPAAARAQSAVDAGAVNGPAARLFPFLGARFGTPARFSVSGGIGVDLDPGVAATQPSREVLLALAPGLGAERGSLTFVYSTGRFGGGFAGGTSVVRTIDHPWNAPASATYVGVDLAVLPIIAIGPRVGILRRVSGTTNDRPWIWTLDFGFGF